MEADGEVVIDSVGQAVAGDTIAQIIPAVGYHVAHDRVMQAPPVVYCEFRGRVW